MRRTGFFSFAKIFTKGCTTCTCLRINMRSHSNDLCGKVLEVFIDRQLLPVSFSMHLHLTPPCAGRASGAGATCMCKCAPVASCWKVRVCACEPVRAVGWLIFVQRFLAPLRFLCSRLSLEFPTRAACKLSSM